jgi:protein-S-isoprenylcysteine O-methyltransferase Ste14
MQRWRVPLGFACALLYLLLARPRPLMLAAGGIISVVGLLLRAWASGHIRKNAELATSGPYAYTRNPLYLGSFIMALGFTIAGGRWLLLVLVASLFLGIYLPVMRVESTTLAELFGARYAEYARQVPLFVPRLSPYRDGHSAGKRFDRGLYLRHGEYRTMLGLLCAWGLLALKTIYFP